MSTQKFIVDANIAGQRLDAACAAAGIFQSRSAAVKQIGVGRVLVNGKPCAKKYVVNTGDIIEADAPVRQQFSLEGEDIPLDIKFEDDHLIVLSKQANLVCHPSANHTSHTLVNALIHHCGLEHLCNLQGVSQDNYDDARECCETEDNVSKCVNPACTNNDNAHTAFPQPDITNFPQLSVTNYPRPGIIHRLDANTTGLMLVAKTNAAGECLMQQIKDRVVDRHYIALVHGIIKQDSGIIDAPLVRHPKERARFMALDPKAHNSLKLVESAKSALTEYTVLERFSLSANAAAGSGARAATSAGINAAPDAPARANAGAISGLEAGESVSTGANTGASAGAAASARAGEDVVISTRAGAVAATTTSASTGVKGASYTLVDCKLFTGRTHQIRAHMEYIKHPVVGDEIYCKHLSKKVLSNASKLERLQLGLERQFLHSYKLAFTHPVTKERMQFEDSLPSDLARALTYLRTSTPVSSLARSAESSHTSHVRAQ